MDILTHVNQAASALGIDFYVAGAVARDYHLNKLDNYIPSRRTEDIDLAVMVSNEVEFIRLKKVLIDTGHFTEHSEAIRLIYHIDKESIELDLLPFGEIEENGITHLTQPNVFTLDMPGFALLNEFTEDVEWQAGLNARVCAIEGIVLLKLIANGDRSHRTKDLSDIQQIIKLYFEVYSDSIYENHFDLMKRYETGDSQYIQKVCAHVIGRELKVILAEDAYLQQRVISILKKDKDDFWSYILDGLVEK